MGRPSRLNHPGLVYHIINRGNNKDVVFVEEDDYRHYLNTLQRYKKQYGFKLFAFCLMMNHVHLLIKTTEQGTISRIMQSLTIAHTRWYNFKYQRCGHVWQGRFHSPLVSEDDHMLTVMQYIEQNPVRAGMAKSVGEYEWDSYKLNTRRQDSLLIDRCENKVFQKMGHALEERIYNYKTSMARTIPDKEVERIRESTRKGHHYASEKFKDQIALLLPRKRERGRPRTRGVGGIML